MRYVEYHVFFVCLNYRRGVSSTPFFFSCELKSCRI